MGSEEIEERKRRRERRKRNKTHNPERTDRGREEVHRQADCCRLSSLLLSLSISLSSHSSSVSTREQIPTLQNHISVHQFQRTR